MAKRKTSKQRLPEEARRTYKIGAKATRSQRDRVRQLAEQCGMTVSDYLLARTLNHQPKARLTPSDLDGLETLAACHSDIVNYTSALRGMSRENRLRFFNNLPFMQEWFRLVARLVETLDRWLKRVREPNRLPDKVIANAEATSDRLADKVDSNAETSSNKPVYR